MRKPVAGLKREETQGERGANAVVGEPAGWTLKALLWRGRDAHMRERAPRHVEEPAAEQTVVERRDADGALQEEIPGIHEHTGSNADGRCADHVLY